MQGLHPEILAIDNERGIEVVRTPAAQGTDNRKRERASHLKWIAISEMKVSPKAQRNFSKAHAEQYAADFDLEALGFPVVSRRDGFYWIVDGQHRIEALKMIGWGDQQVQCECYEELTEADEAELFLRRDTRTAITALDKFMIGLVAERQPEIDINRTVQGLGLRIGTKGGSGSSDRTITAVQGLRKVFDLGGASLLRRALRLLRDGFPDEGEAFKSHIIQGMGLTAHRYGEALKDEVVLERFLALRGGSSGLRRKAETLHSRTDRGVPDCVAAAVVEVYNGGRGGTKLESWWK